MSAIYSLLGLSDQEPACTLHWIGTILGHDGSSTDLEDYVTTLIAEEGFPAPFPHRKHGGGLTRDVHYKRSRWLKAAVIDWICDQLPPGTGEAIDDKKRSDAAQEMDARASNLHLVANNDRGVLA